MTKNEKSLIDNLGTATYMLMLVVLSYYNIKAGLIAVGFITLTGVLEFWFKRKEER